MSASEGGNMAASPRWKVYDYNREYIAACKHAEDAAALAALRGPGTTIRAGHSLVVWTEGAEDQSAGDSYDHVANVIRSRLTEHGQ